MIRRRAIHLAKSQLSQLLPAMAIVVANSLWHGEDAKTKRDSEDPAETEHDAPGS